MAFWTNECFLLPGNLAGQIQANEHMSRGLPRAASDESRPNPFSAALAAWLIGEIMIRNIKMMSVNSTFLCNTLLLGKAVHELAIITITVTAVAITLGQF